MANYLDVTVLTSNETRMAVNAYPESGFVVVAVGELYGSEVRIHLRQAEIDRLAAVLDEARRALPASPVKAAA